MEKVVWGYELRVFFDNLSNNTLKLMVFNV